MSLGIAIETIAYLVLAVIALAILFIVFSGFAPKIPDFITQTFNKFIGWLCDRLGWAVGGLCRFSTGH